MSITTRWGGTARAHQADVEETALRKSRRLRHEVRDFRNSLLIYATLSAIFVGLDFFVGGGSGLFARFGWSLIPVGWGASLLLLHATSVFLFPPRVVLPSEEHEVEWLRQKELVRKDRIDPLFSSRLSRG